MPVQVTGPPEGVRGSRVDLERLRHRADGMLVHLGHAQSEISIALADDREICDLNLRWRNLDRPTDVLSFSLVDGTASEYRGRLLGDVVISVETAAVQAAARHRGLDDEIARLLIHGLLHIVGHDHETEEEARVMRAEERRLWRDTCT